MKARIKFRKYGVLKFIGHLDVMRFFQKAMRRADIPIAFTGGYSPHMIMSFASPLGIGLTSEGEYFDIELDEKKFSENPLTSEEAVRRLNETMAEGIDVVSFRQISDEKKQTGMAIVAASDYRVLLPENFLQTIRERTAQRNSAESGIDGAVNSPDLSDLCCGFLEQPEIRVMKQTKRSEREVDIRALIYQFTWTNAGTLSMQVAAGSTENLKPELVMESFCKFCGLDMAKFLFRYHRVEMYADHGTDDVHEFISLEDLGWEL